MAISQLPTLPVDRLLKGRRAIAGGVPEGLDALLLAELARHAAAGGALLHVARDANRLATLEEAIPFFAPDVQVLSFPAWDGVPYDRVAPNAETIAQRIETLAALMDHAPKPKRPLVVLTTIHAALQRVPPREFIGGSAVKLHAGNVTSMQSLIEKLETSGYARAGTVMDPGQYAVRGGILDLYPPGGEPVRLDFFGDTLESIRAFDPETQRTKARREEVQLLPMSEVALTPEVRSAFRQRYVALFGPVTGDDPLYESISAGRQHQGMEHWLPLFQERLVPLFDYLPCAVVSLDPLVEDARSKRLEQIADHYDARAQALERKAFGAPPYHPVPPESMFLSEADWEQALADRHVIALDPFEHPEQPGATVVSFGGRQGRTYAAERQTEGVNVFDAVVTHAKRLQGDYKRVIVACWSNGARERLATLLAEHGGGDTANVKSFAEALDLPPSTTAVAVLPLETGFEAPGIAVIGEQDILGDRLVRKSRGKRGSDVLTEASSLAFGDLVVHADHGIGRFAGLATIEAAGEPHDCLEVHYAGGDKLYLPVENIELLSRYGSDESGAQLDRLGGVGWQSRKARLKQRIRAMAEKLIKVAALRELRQAPVLTPPEGVYDEFSARFPYEETDDQTASIGAVVDDLGSGRPMDRLICGDVGFGKTEVALRASLIAVLAGKQVVVVVPTTLLARQHFHTFTERFRGFPVKIAQASRLVSPKERAEMKAGIKSGDIDIVVGTHALLAKGIEFADLGLLIVDEEQHFGVQHKERLKQLREDVHVLTLTATPIPRTLQLALSGVREMSLISTPPVDRLAVRTYVTPFDPVILREALLRERYRGGQTFYVVPRISDLDDAAAFLQEHSPELKVGARPRPDGKPRARRRDECLLRPAIRRAAVDLDRRVRTRHPVGEHADRASLRHVRARSALSAAGPRRAFQDQGLCLFHDSRRCAPDACGREAAQGAAIARHARRRLRPRKLRPRHQGSRQSLGRGAVGSHQGGRLRALSVDAGRGCGGHQGRRGRDRGPMVAAHQSRHLGADPGGIRSRPPSQARALSPAVGRRKTRCHRGLCRRADRPLRPDAARGTPSARRGRDQGAVPTGRHRADRCRARRARSSPSATRPSPIPRG